MQTSVTEVELGVCRAAIFDRGGAAWAIVLPGAGYSTDAPLLWYAREVALAGGRNVLAVRDRFDRQRDDPIRWVHERVVAALDHVASRDERPVLVAKSLTSLAARTAARSRLPAVWLTPLINSSGTSVAREVVDGLSAASAPMLLVGGTADPTWDRVVARSFAGAQVLELPDADHSLQLPALPTRSLDLLGTVVDAMAGFLDSLSPGSKANASDAELIAIDHVQLAIPPGGEAAARGFYGVLLGLREVEKPEALAGRGGCWFVGGGRVHLHLGIEDGFRPARKAHPAIVVSDLALLRRRLESAGVDTADDPSHAGIRRFYASDPFGNRIEFIDRSHAGFTERGRTPP